MLLVVPRRSGHPTSTYDSRCSSSVGPINSCTPGPHQSAPADVCGYLTAAYSNGQPQRNKSISSQTNLLRQVSQPSLGLSTIRFGSLVQPKSSVDSPDRGTKREVS
ncbi:unnamed protein product [Protopolystoma xenopodis]|uniref:Uncharacterized protein n=1 Tax=Protopolystoma xenopodis TaxID=117903 RepID=A0A448XMY7_9PLAT|nr:unnamed protein product [Protopolystoma xenopodis]